MKTVVQAMIFVAAALTILAGCAASQDSTQTAGRKALMADGKALAQMQCSACHAIGRTDASLRTDAPAFRSILSRYRADVLEDELVEGIKLGHPDMPQFKLNPRAVDALVEYLKSIQSQAPIAKPDTR